ncbi:hypothetical protein DSL72_008509 [Monilinia vaccinii-corymbosi]|uniref:Uncharacterized protein n=1 Tax=Monilinia vaccinii-corymbosi TaxID=61207 RepID=A0A8A3PKY3_9HELO|nr:hypothetical protein DSL72_008509 [Monilinia vaccinii-corymbosi]
MPPNPRAAAPKIDNNTLVGNAIGKQIDIASDFKLIWNKLDQVRLAQDMGVGSTNAASKRFKRWVVWIEKSAQLNGDAEDTTDTVDKAGPIRKSEGKKIDYDRKNEIKREGSLSESAKKEDGKEGNVGKRMKTEDGELTDKDQEKQEFPRTTARMFSNMNPKTVYQDREAVEQGQ